MKKDEIIRSYYYRSFESIRVWMMIAMILNSAFGLLDNYLVSQNLLVFVLIRYALVLPLSLGLFFFTYHIKENLRLFQFVVVSFLVVTAAGMLAMMCLFSPSDKGLQLYFIGLLAMIVWTKMIGVKSSILIMITAVIAAVYNIILITIFTLHRSDFSFFVVSNLFLLTFIVFAVFSSRMTENFIFADYQKSLILQEEKHKILEKKEQLKKLNTFKSKLVSVISHDLRGPLCSVKPLIELYSRGVVTGNEFQANIKKILNSIESLELLLDGTLVWSSVESSKHILNKKMVNLYEAVNGIFHLLELQAEHKSIRLFNNVDRDTLVYADANALSIVLRNLVGNALKFTQGGYVELKSALHQNWVEISVIDTGVGISDNALGNLNSTDGTSHEKGFGFGLKVCMEVIKLHGGILRCFNHSDGATFSFTLPSKEQLN